MTIGDDNPWDQATGLEGLDDDQDIDEDGEELAGPADHADAPPPAPAEHAPRLRIPAQTNQRRPARASARKYRIQKMSERMARLFPTSESVLLTSKGGAQVLFVRG